MKKRYEVWINNECVLETNDYEQANSCFSSARSASQCEDDFQSYYGNFANVLFVENEIKEDDE